MAIAIPALSISGSPLLGGFASKIITLDTLTGWQQIVMNVAAVGTAIAFAKLLFLPVQAKAISAQDSSPKKGKVAALWAHGPVWYLG